VFSEYAVHQDPILHERYSVPGMPQLVSSTPNETQEGEFVPLRRRITDLPGKLLREQVFLARGLKAFAQSGRHIINNWWVGSPCTETARASREFHIGFFLLSISLDRQGPGQYPVVPPGSICSYAIPLLARLNRCEGPPQEILLREAGATVRRPVLARGPK
jgi:hypothetical protein